MQRLLFAIVQGPPVSWRPPRSALGMIETRAFDELVVVSSQLERIPEPNTRTRALHHDVVAATMEADGVLPFPFGTALDARELEGSPAGGHAVRAPRAAARPPRSPRRGPARLWSGWRPGIDRSPPSPAEGWGAGRRLAGPSRFGIPLGRISRGTS